MKQKLLFVLLTVIIVVSCAIGLVACGRNNEKDGSSVNGTYYLYENESLDKTQYITLNNGNWTDDDDENGTYTLNGSAIIFYADILGSKEELYSGTIKDGILTLNIMGAEVVYRKDGSSVTDPDKPVEKTLNFKLSGDNSYYIVSGIGGLSGAITVPETYENKPVQQIADNAFAGEISLTEITLPQSITTIGANAFADCSNLASVELSEGLTVIPESTFSGCGKLTKITIPSSVSKIEKDAFSDCDTLADIYYLGTVSDWSQIQFNYYESSNGINFSNPLYIAENLYIDNEIVTDLTIDSASAIAPTAFINYNKLENVTIDMGGSIGEYAFYRCENLETLNLNSVTTIDDYAFFRCAKLAEVNIPDTTTKIGYAAFGYCTALKSLTTGDGIIEIGDYAFENCTVLQSAILGNAVTDIGDLAFTSCQNLSKLTFGNSLSAIGEMAFYMCDNLREVTFPASLMYIGEQAFGYLTSAVFESPSGWSIGNKNNTELSEETLKNPQEAAKLLTTSILHGGYYENYWEVNTLVYTLSKDGTYYSVKNKGTNTRREVVIPSEYKGIPVTQIEENAFKDCTQLRNVTLLDSILTIGNGAFRGCVNLTSVTLPNSITSIGNEAFRECYDLVEVKTGDRLQSIGESAFFSCHSLTSITIPENVTVIQDGAFNGCSALIIFCEVESQPDSWSEYWYGGCPIVWDCKNNEIAEDGNIYAFVDGIMYSIKDKSATVAKQPQSISGSVTIPQSIQYQGISYTVKGITENAFDSCTQLNSITLPNSITFIRSNAFFDCTALTEVRISDITAWCAICFDNQQANPLYYAEILYINGKSVTDLTIPNTVKQINDYAFYNCNNLTSITIPKSVTYIGSYVFSDCSSLTIFCENEAKPKDWNAYWNGDCPIVWDYKNNDTAEDANVYLVVDGIRYALKDGIATVVRQSSLLEGSILISSSVEYKNIKYEVKSIDDNAFSGCNALTRVTISDGIEIIGEYAFNGCSALTSVIIPDSVTVIGTGAFSDCSSLASISLPKNVTTIENSLFSGCINLNEVILPDKLVTIKSFAFYQCGSLERVSIPDSVIEIDSYAFSYCTAEIQWGDFPSVTDIRLAFENYLGTSIVIPDSVTEIGEREFEGSSSLLSVTIGNGVKSIGAHAFEDSINLVNLTIGEGVETIEGSVFVNCNKITCINFNAIACKDFVSPAGNYVFPIGINITVNIGEKVTRIPRGMFHPKPFSEGSNITVVNFAENSVCESIGDYAFYCCNKLTSITIPESVTSIGNYAFSECSNLTDVTIPNDLTSIGNYAFSECISLTDITIPESVTSIGNYAFSYCGSLSYNEYDNGFYLGNESNPFIILIKVKDNSITTCKIHENTKFIHESVFYGCNKLNNVIIPEGITSIPEKMFYDCRSLTNITIPDSVTIIEDFAFEGCRSLTGVYITDIAAWCKISFGNSHPLYYAGNLYLNNELVTELVIPNSVTSIGDKAFFYCTSLASVIISDSVTSIGSYAFDGCTSLTSVTFKNTSGWRRSTSSTATSGTSISESDLAAPSTAAKYLTSTYCGYYWRRG